MELTYESIHKGDTVIFHRRGDTADESSSIAYVSRNYGGGKLRLLLIPENGGTVSLVQTVYHKDDAYLKDKPQLAGMGGTWDYKPSDKARAKSMADEVRKVVEQLLGNEKKHAAK